MFQHKPPHDVCGLNRNELSAGFESLILYLYFYVDINENHYRVHLPQKRLLDTSPDGKWHMAHLELELVRIREEIPGRTVDQDVHSAVFLHREWHGRICVLPRSMYI